MEECVGGRMWLRAKKETGLWREECGVVMIIGNEVTARENMAQVFRIGRRDSR